MATPYDGIIRIRERETDEAAQVLRACAERVAQIEQQIEAAKSSIKAEASFVPSDMPVRSDLYLLRMYSEVERLGTTLRDAMTELEEHRESLLQLVAETKALESVAENYREQRRAQEARAEQAQLDDRIAFVHGNQARMDRERVMS